MVRPMGAYIPHFRFVVEHRRASGNEREVEMASMVNSAGLRLLRDTQEEILVDIDLLSRAKEKEQLEPRCRVLLHNDDITPIEYVPRLLRDIFGIGLARALWITVKAHAAGHAEVVVEPCPRAHAHVAESRARAQADGHVHLHLSAEPID
jgi:ATP-dependent Clp protease adapter protein ClpS